MAQETQRRARRERNDGELRIPTWDEVYKRNSLEQVKREKFPLDIVDDLPEMIAMGYEAVPEEDIVRLNWWGLTHDKPKVGTFMVRIKVPGGYLKPWQLRTVGEISRKYGRGYGEMTTRQGLQLHWVRLDQLPEVLDAVQQGGLTTAGGEGDTVRNITGCPVAGISRDELFDVTPVIQEVAGYFFGNRDYSNLPRKHKYTISSCSFQCNAPEIHDVALIGVVKDGREGFSLQVGGGLSATPRLSRDLGVFLPKEETVEVLRAVTDAWQENPRYRLSRAKARIKFMMDDYGPEGVRRMVEERIDRKLEDVESPLPKGETDHLGVNPQRQEGFYHVGFPVPVGWMTGDQMVQIADIVDEISGDIRLTRQQNFIVGNVPEDRVEWVKERIAEIGFPIDRNPAYGTSIACTSHKFCNYSVAETKEKLNEVIQELDAEYGSQITGLKVYMDGCPHACAHHWIGDIGLQGTTAKMPDGERVEAYDITLRGGAGPNATIGKPIIRRLPGEDLNKAMSRLVGAWLSEKRAMNGSGDQFGFREFCEAHSDEELQGIASGDAAVAADEPRQDVAFIRIPGMLLEMTSGADYLEIKARTVGEAIEVAGKEYPALKEYLLDGEEEINSYVNLFLDDDDVRSLQGLATPVKPGNEIVILPAMAGG